MAKRKLSKSDYMIIFNLHVDGYSNADIAKQFNVNPSCISKVLHRKFELKTDRSCHRNANCKLKTEDVEKIRMFREKGYTYGTIAVLVGVSSSHCGKIVNKTRWSKNNLKAS